MNLFEEHILLVKNLFNPESGLGQVRELPKMPDLFWPASSRSDIVFAEDMRVELGHPRDESVSFIMWTDKPGLVDDGKISLIGPDLDEGPSKNLSFGKVLLIQANGFDETNTYDRYQQMELLRYDIKLKGYMMRAVSQYMREWSRISKEAIQKGFTFSILSTALMDRYKTLDFVNKVEVLLMTSNREDVKQLKLIGEKTMRIVSAMNKMVEEESYDCSSCDYADVCSDVEDLRNMRKNDRQLPKYA